MSLFDGIRNLFDKEDENDVEVPKKSSWFSPYYALDYQDNKDAYDQANYYWTTGKFPVIEHEEIEKNCCSGWKKITNGYTAIFWDCFNFHLKYFVSIQTHTPHAAWCCQVRREGR